MCEIAALDETAWVLDMPGAALIKYLHYVEFWNAATSSSSQPQHASLIYALFLTQLVANLCMKQQKLIACREF